MKIAILAGAIIFLFATNSWAASVNTTRSNTFKIEQRGTIVTASTSISGAVSQIVYTTPATGDFVLTQVCVGLASGGVLLQVGASASPK